MVSGGTLIGQASMKYVSDNLSFDFQQLGGVNEALQFVERLHPNLQAILDIELAAGNYISEASGGWPDSDSVFVGLKYGFLAEHQSKPGVNHRIVNDPHWWKEEYIVETPTHILVCGFLLKGSYEDRVRRQSNYSPAEKPNAN